MSVEMTAIIEAEGQITCDQCGENEFGSFNVDSGETELYDIDPQYLIDAVNGDWLEHPDDDESHFCSEACLKEYIIEHGEFQLNCDHCQKASPEINIDSYTAEELRDLEDDIEGLADIFDWLMPEDDIFNGEIFCSKECKDAWVVAENNNGLEPEGVKNDLEAEEVNWPKCSKCEGGTDPEDKFYRHCGHKFNVE